MKSVKVLCGKCRKQLGAVIETPDGGMGYLITAGRGGWTNWASGVFCPEHGWPDLADPKLAEKLAFTREGDVRTHQAKMCRTPPIPQ